MRTVALCDTDDDHGWNAVIVGEEPGQEVNNSM
jgi:hypothetical protein